MKLFSSQFLSKLTAKIWLLITDKKFYGIDPKSSTFANLEAKLLSFHKHSPLDDVHCSEAQEGNQSFNKFT